MPRFKSLERMAPVLAAVRGIGVHQLAVLLKLVAMQHL
jgi:hypothetical protein